MIVPPVDAVDIPSLPLVAYDNMTTQLHHKNHIQVVDVDPVDNHPHAHPHSQFVHAEPHETYVPALSHSEPLPPPQVHPVHHAIPHELLIAQPHPHP